LIGLFRLLVPVFARFLDWTRAAVESTPSATSTPRLPDASSARPSSLLRLSSGSTRARMARAAFSPSRDARISTESLPTSDSPPSLLSS
ncbi:hypothetical protein PENTCL1PPCAC_24050, partial [Pristionchus entomophagus]